MRAREVARRCLGETNDEHLITAVPLVRLFAYLLSPQLETCPRGRTLPASARLPNSLSPKSDPCWDVSAFSLPRGPAKRHSDQSCDFVGSLNAGLSGRGKG